MWTWAGHYQNVFILDFIGAKGNGGGGDNWNYVTCKAPVKISPPTNTNQHPVFYRPDALPSPNQQYQSTEGKNITFHGLAYPKLTWGVFQLCI